MPGKNFKAIEKLLRRFGYEYNRCNSSSQWIYTCDGRADVNVSPDISERAAKVITKQLQKTHGAYESGPKRNALAVKERQAREREALKSEAARLDAERQAILTERDKRLGGLGAVLSSSDLHDMAMKIEQIDRERHEIERLMGAPLGQGRVSYQAGSR